MSHRNPFFTLMFQCRTSRCLRVRLTHIHSIAHCIQQSRRALRATSPRSPRPSTLYRLSRKYPAQTCLARDTVTSCSSSQRLTPSKPSSGVWEENMRRRALIAANHALTRVCATLVSEACWIARSSATTQDYYSTVASLLGGRPARYVCLFTYWIICSFSRATATNWVSRCSQWSRGVFWKHLKPEGPRPRPSRDSCRPAPSQGLRSNCDKHSQPDLIERAAAKQLAAKRSKIPSSVDNFEGKSYLGSDVITIPPGRHTCGAETKSLSLPQ